MKNDLKSKNNKELKYQLIGWILFIICAIFFLASSFINGDMISFIGSILFLIACIFFIIPLVEAYNDDKKMIDVEK